METMENWRPAVGFEGSYEVSDLGRIRSVARRDTIGRRVPPHVLTNARLSGRYLRIRLRKDGHVERFVHLMVLEAFIGPRPPGLQACHNDGDRMNNALANLRWDTPSRNQRDKLAHGTMARGSRNGAAVLTDERVWRIRSLIGLGVGPMAVSRAFGLSRKHVQSIKRRESWEWLPTREPTAHERRIASRLVEAAAEQKAASHAVAVLKPGSPRAANALARARRSERVYGRALAVAVTFHDQEEAAI